MINEPRASHYADVEHDGRYDALLHDYGPDPGPGDEGYVPSPEEYREERRNAHRRRT